MAQLEEEARQAKTSVQEREKIQQIVEQVSSQLVSCLLIANNTRARNWKM